MIVYLTEQDIASSRVVYSYMMMRVYEYDVYTYKERGGGGGEVGLSILG